MKASIDRRASPSREDLASLFTQGSVSAPPNALQPSYTQRTGDTLRLRARSLRDPAVFLKAVRDYVLSCALSLWDHSSTLGDTDAQRQDNIDACERVLRKDKQRFRNRLTQSAVRQRLNGQEAEHAIATWTRSMLRCFSTDSSFDVSVPEWSQHEKSIRLGDGYVVHPHPPTNFILVKGTPQKHECLGEMDILALIGDDTLFCLDVSTSAIAIQEKLCTVPERLFLDFRKRMKDLFRESGKQQGFHDVAKMHVHCGTQYTYPSARGPAGDECGVFHLELPARDIVGALTDRVTRQLREAGISWMMGTETTVCGAGEASTTRRCTPGRNSENPRRRRRWEPTGSP